MALFLHVFVGVLILVSDQYHLQRCIDFIESLQKDIIVKYKSSSILVIVRKILAKLWPILVC